MGSGSTLLRLVLDSHDNIAIPGETGFMRLVQAHRWVPLWRLGDQWYRNLGMTRGELDEALRGFYGGMFERYAARQGKTRWGDKTPLHVWHIAAIAELFPDAVFVGIVRHPAATAVSLRERFGYPLERAVAHWRDLNAELVDKSRTLGSRAVLLRYEDLVAEPEPVLRALLEWLGEPWSARVLTHHEVQERQGAPRVVEGQTRSTDPLDADRARQWVDRLDAAELAGLAERLGGWPAFFGYDVRRPEPVASIGDRGPLLTGVGLAARCASYAGQVDFTPPPRPRREDPLRPRRRAKPLSADTLPEWTVEPARAVLDRMPRDASASVRRWRDRVVAWSRSVGRRQG